MGNANSQEEFSWIVDVEINGTATAFLGEDPQAQHKNTQEEKEEIPRQIVANLGAVRRTHFTAGINRPIIIGTYGNEPAYLLCCNFGFHRTVDTWLTRIRGATITIDFEDAPHTEKDPLGEDPAVVRFYPEQSPFMGTKSYGTATTSVEVKQLIGSASPVCFKAAYSKTVEGGLIISGTTAGKGMFRVVWRLLENQVSKSGMPRTVTLPVIVVPRGKRRFKATLDVKMDYSWVNQLVPGVGQSAPLAGKNVEPVFFDPGVLEKLARDKVRSRVDKKTIVTVLDEESLENIELAKYSHISEC